MKSANVFRVLAFGDIIGDPGRRALNNVLKRFQAHYQPDSIVVNGENSAHGFGITEKIYDDLLDRGVNVITTGNHVWQKKEIFNFVDKSPALLRPLNYPAGTPGRGWGIYESGGIKYAVINAMGRVYMDPIDCPFQTVAKAIEEINKEGVNIILLDFHAEATSEKQVMGRYFDGKLSAVWGTHTHIQTADETIFPGKTAYISDIGMCGSVKSIIGMKVEESFRRVVEHLPVRFSPADQGTLFVNGIVLDIDKKTGKALLISRIREEFELYASNR